MIVVMMMPVLLDMFIRLVVADNDNDDDCNDDDCCDDDASVVGHGHVCQVGS